MHFLQRCIIYNLVDQASIDIEIQPGILVGLGRKKKFLKTHTPYNGICAKKIKKIKIFTKPAIANKSLDDLRALHKHCNNY